MDDAGSLANLRDLALPPAVSLWPPAPGASILLLALLACIAVALWQLAARNRANAFRRQAAREIAAVDPASSDAAIELFAILKRVALVLHPRVEVAPLTGGALVAFLSKHSAIDASLAQRLADASFDPRGRVDPGDARRFAEEAAAWVKRER